MTKRKKNFWIQSKLINKTKEAVVEITLIKENKAKWNSGQNRQQQGKQCTSKVNINKNNGV